jgi:prefoldin subunit 5
MGTDPEHAQKVGEQILAGLEGLKEQLTIEQIIDSLTRNEDVMAQKIEELTQAINRLNGYLDKLTQPGKE